MCAYRMFAVCLGLVFSTFATEPMTLQVESSLRKKVAIKGQALQKEDIASRMQYFNVPGVSIAIVFEGKITWAKGYGHLSKDLKSSLVTEHTLFQAGSISKPITAFGALILVQQGKIDLDKDVNLYLKRWKVPVNTFTKTDKVTLRRLLSHTAGTNVGGFPGYPIGVTTPSVVEVLEGKKPKVNTEPVQVITRPGTELKYSGGGTTIVQLLIEDITAEPFDEWMQKNVLTPLGMVESTFTMPLPLALADLTATGYHGNTAVVGKWHQYPEMAAAGLWSTPKDLAQFIIYIQSALKGERNYPLKLEYVKKMITRQKIAPNQDIAVGLGPFLQNSGDDLVFMHKGQDEGFIANLIGFAYQGFGHVIMMNNDAGWPLMEEITNSIADVYKWPHFEVVEKEEIALDPSKFKDLPGLYVNNEEKLEISLTKGKLFIDFKNGAGPLSLYPSSECTFFMQEEDLTIAFPQCEGKLLTLIDKENVKKTYVKNPVK